MVNTETSLSSAPPGSGPALISLTKTLTRNPRQAIESRPIFFHLTQPNGTSQSHLDFVTCQSNVSFFFCILFSWPSHSIRVAHSDLGIKVGRPKIHPPHVCLMSCGRIWVINSLIARTRASGSVAMGVCARGRGWWVNCNSTSSSGTKWPRMIRLFKCKSCVNFCDFWRVCSRCTNYQ